MAVSISLLFGRLGAVTGSNLTALLIENHCDSVFLLTAFSLIGKKNFTNELNHNFSSIFVFFRKLHIGVFCSENTRKIIKKI